MQTPTTTQLRSTIEGLNKLGERLTARASDSAMQLRESPFDNHQAGRIEVKAIASGNPLVIEKAQVDAELMKLTRLRSAHAEECQRKSFNLERNIDTNWCHSSRQSQTATGGLTSLLRRDSITQ